MFDRLKTFEALWSLWNLLWEQLVKWGVTALVVGMIATIGAFVYSVAEWINSFGLAGWAAAVFAVVLTIIVTVGLGAWSLGQVRKLRTGKSDSAPAAPPPRSLEKNLDAQSQRDLLILLDHAVYQNTVLMLDNLLRAAPEGIIEGPLQISGNLTSKHAEAREFIELVRDKLDPGSWRRSNFESVMRIAEGSAEHQIEKTPMSVRPPEIDPLSLRKWAIAYLQCAEAIRFLRHQKAEAEKNLLNQRFTLLQQYQLRNPS